MKHFIFDLGGVIKYKISNEKISDSIITPKDNCVVEYFKYYKELERGKYSYNEFIDLIRPLLKYPDREYIEYEEEYHNILKKYGGIYQDTIDVILNLKNKGYKIYLLSNLIELTYQELREEIDINIFDKVFLSYEISYIKPEKEIYEYVLNNINDNVDNIYFFDDSEKNVKAALELGINAYVVDGSNIKQVFQNIFKINE